LSDSMGLMGLTSLVGSKYTVFAYS
jgi:hypothetical protein